MNCFYDRGRRDHVVEFYSGFLHHLVLNNHSAGGFGRGWGACVILKPCPSPLNSCRQMLSEWPCHLRGDPKLSLKAQTKPRQNSATTSCCERLLLVFSAQILLPCLITHRGFTFSKLLGKKFTVLLCLHPWRGANRKKDLFQWHLWPSVSMSVSGAQFLSSSRGIWYIAAGKRV